MFLVWKLIIAFSVSSQLMIPLLSNETLPMQNTQNHNFIIFFLPRDLSLICGYQSFIAKLYILFLISSLFSWYVSQTASASYHHDHVYCTCIPWTKPAKNEFLSSHQTKKKLQFVSKVIQLKITPAIRLFYFHFIKFTDGTFWTDE